MDHQITETIVYSIGLIKTPDQKYFRINAKNKFY
jgi:hypothetical protein